MDGMCLDALLGRLMRSAFEQAFPGQAKAMDAVFVAPSASEAFGDYQCNSAMALAKVLKRPPREAAAQVIGSMPAHPCIERAEIAGPGFINLFLSRQWLGDAIDLMGRDARLGVPLPGAGQTLLMDYGSPNITKPLHIGHLRSPNIGNALDRMFRFLGYRVIADNHLGDWGTQFGITIMGYREFGDAQAMAASPMEELERVYVKSYERTKSDPDWLARCRQELVKLQSGDAGNLRLWQEFVDLSKAELGRIYARLGFRFDLTRGESHYRDKLQAVVDELARRGIARESEGALVALLDHPSLEPAIVRKRDGGFNYATFDIATVFSRVNEFKPDRIIYVTDERQQLHFKQVFEICRQLGLTVGLEHVWFGLMRLPEGTFSTREGNVIRLEKLLDEAESRALAIVKENSPDMPEARQREVAKAVGIGAVKYADLSQNPQSLVTFTWEKALALNGNSAPYLQYACARIASVLDKYAERFPAGRPDEHPLRIEDPAERRLALHLARFPETVARAATGCRPNALTDYLYDLAQAYSTFYQNVPFLRSPDGVRESRVRLCRITSLVLRKGLDLLGIEAPDRI